MIPQEQWSRSRGGVVVQGIPTDGLVAHYTMDSITGSTLVDEMGSYDGTISGATSVSGILGSALSFNGTTDKVDLGDVFKFTSSFSLSFWIYSDVVNPGAEGNGIISKDEGTRSWSAQLHNANNTIRFGVSSNGSNYISRDCNTSILASTWYHFACIYDATNLLLDVYRGGSLDNGALNNGPVPSSVYNSTVTSKIGTSTSSELTHWDGLIDQVRVYDRAISASEVALLYAEG